MKDIDPNGINQHDSGAKLDAGKIRAGLVLGDFATALKRVCEVGTFGADKYSDSGWLDVPNGVERYRDAMMRHYLARESGEVVDPDSGLEHLWHIAWNALAITELTEREHKNAILTETFYSEGEDSCCG